MYTSLEQVGLPTLFPIEDRKKWDTSTSGAAEYMEFAHILQQVLVAIPGMRNRELRMQAATQLNNDYSGSIIGDLQKRIALLMGGELPEVEREIADVDTDACTCP